MRAARVLLMVLLGMATPAASALEFTSIGVKAGIGRVSTDFQYNGEELFDPDAEWVAIGGASAQWRLHRQSRFDLLTEAWWLRPGFTESGELRQATMLGLPILLRSSVQSRDPETYVYFGLSPEFVLDADSHPILDNYKDFALAGQAGIGIEKRLRKGVVGQIEFRFSAEFTNLYDAPAGDPIENLTHRWLQINSGVRF